MAEEKTYNGWVRTCGWAARDASGFFSPFEFTRRKEKLGASACGGLKEAQEMIDFAAKHNMSADIEVISMDYVNKAMEHLEKGDIRHQFVIDIGITLGAASVK